MAPGRRASTSPRPPILTQTPLPPAPLIRQHALLDDQGASFTAVAAVCSRVGRGGRRLTHGPPSLRPSDLLPSQLNDGRHIPEIGFGSWKLGNGQQVSDQVEQALDVGFEHVDTAQVRRLGRASGGARRQQQLTLAPPISSLRPRSTATKRRSEQESRTLACPATTSGASAPLAPEARLPRPLRCAGEAAERC